MDRASLSAAASGHAEGGVAPVTLSPSLQCTCALLCGYLAAGVDPGDGVAILRLVAIWLLADATCGHVLNQLVALRVCVQTSVAQSGQRAAASDSPRYSSLSKTPPDDSEGTPAGLAAWLRHRVDACRDPMSARGLTHGLAALVTSALVLVVATYLGREVLALVGFGLFSAACVVILSGRDVRVLTRWFAGLHVALAWQLGYVALAPWDSLALSVAAFMGLGTWARARLAQGHSAMAQWVMAAIQVIWIILLLVRGQPVLAASVAILTLGERIAQPPLRGHLAWLLSMALVALGVRYWN